MLTTHKISAELYLESFELIALHSSLEDYAMAYTLNQEGGLQLKRGTKDQSLGDGISFSLYEWVDEVRDNHYTLFANHRSMEHNQKADGLFDEDIATVTHHLIEERKEVDYFLKIETDQADLVEKMVKKFNGLPNVVTAYRIYADTLKSKKNLIF